MDTLHRVISSIHTETKSGTTSETKAGHDPVSVFRKFLAHLDRMHVKAPVRPARARTPQAKHHGKPQPRSKPGKRGR